MAQVYFFPIGRRDEWFRKRWWEMRMMALVHLHSCLCSEEREEIANDSANGRGVIEGPVNFGWRIKDRVARLKR
jgi:hypothetical protein